MTFSAADITMALRKRGCPLRHVRFKGSHAATPWSDALGRINQATDADNDFLCVLLGVPGTGKTQMAVEWLRHVLRTTQRDHADASYADGWLPTRVLYRLASQVFREVRETFSVGSRNTEEQVVSRLTHVPALVIDEIDNRARSDFEARMLRDILNCRYADLMRTVIVSNDRDRRVFLDRQPEYLTSRLSESGLFIECDWPSFREK